MGAFYEWPSATVQLCGRLLPADNLKSSPTARSARIGMPPRMRTYDDRLHTVSAAKHACAHEAVLRSLISVSSQGTPEH